MEFIIPKDIIPIGSKIALYGYGDVGINMLDRIKQEEYCEVVCIFDKKMSGDIIYDIPIVKIEDYEEYSFEYILVCSLKYQSEICNELYKRNVPKSIIVLLGEQYKIKQNRENIPIMEIDTTSFSCAETFGEYVRYRTLELISYQINKKGIEGDIAEAGVYMGNFSKALHALFPNRRLYLYDTYEGFLKSDIDIDVNRGYTSKERIDKGIFKSDFITSDNQIEIIKKKLGNVENVIFRKGNFPDSIGCEERNSKFAFVSLDMDLYRPIKDGLFFFYPKLSLGGIIFLHDYNAIEHSRGIKHAVDELEEKYGYIAKVPLCDEYGTLVLVKV